MNVILIARGFEYRGVNEEQLICLQRRTKFGREIGICANPEQDDARIREVGLTLSLVRSQRIEQAILTGYCDPAAAEQRYRLTNPETRIGAGNQRVFEDRIEACRFIVVRVAVAAAIHAGRLDA